MYWPAIVLAAIILGLAWSLLSQRVFSVILFLPWPPVDCAHLPHRRALSLCFCLTPSSQPCSLLFCARHMVVMGIGFSFS
jgi:hypothetical protein